MLNQYHPRAPLKSIFVQNRPKPYCHFVIIGCFSPDWVGGGKNKGNNIAVDSFGQRAACKANPLIAQGIALRESDTANQRPTGAKALETEPASYSAFA